MRLDYKILWIEDDISWKKSIQNDIEKHIHDQGYNPIIVAPELIDRTYIEHQDFKDFDIMLIDYALKSLSQENGDELIKKIRNKKIFTNIVFYSSDPERIKSETSDKKLDGVYIFDRTQLEKDGIEDFFDLIDFFMKKDMDLSSLRGIAMSELADFDKIIWNILKTEKCKKAVCEKIKKQKKNNYEEIKDLSEDMLWEMVNEKGTAILDSSTRKDILHSKILKTKYSCDTKCSKREDCYLEILNKYSLEVLDIRNKLAHLSNDADLPENRITFMKNLIKFREIFKKMEICLCNKQ